MGETLEEILAKQTGSQGETLEEILSRTKKLTYPFPQEPRPTTDFQRVGPHKMAYVGTGRTQADIEPASQALGNFGKFAAENVVPLATMEFGGSLIPRTLVKARPLIGTALKVGARAAGFAAGSEATAPLEGEMPSLSRGLRTARNIALTEGAVRGLAYPLARAGSVEPAAAAMAQDNPALLKKVSPEEYARLSAQISDVPVPQTAEHTSYLNLAKTKGKIDGMPYVNQMLGAIRKGVDEPTARLIERKTGSLAESLFNRLGPDGKITAEALDDWLRTNISEPAARVYEKGAGSAWQERLASLRDQMVPQLYKDIGGGATELQRTASTKIGKVNAAKSVMPAPSETKMNLQTPGYLRQVMKDSDLGYQIRTRLAGLDEVANTNFLPRVEDLAMRSSWTAAEKAEVEDILANVPAIGYERVGMVRAGARKIARGMTRAARPTGRMVGLMSNVRGTSQ